MEQHNRDAAVHLNLHFLLNLTCPSWNLQLHLKGFYSAWCRNLTPDWNKYSSWTYNIFGPAPPEVENNCLIFNIYVCWYQELMFPSKLWPKLFFKLCSLFSSALLLTPFARQQSESWEKWIIGAIQDVISCIEWQNTCTMEDIYKLSFIIIQLLRAYTQFHSGSCIFKAISKNSRTLAFLSSQFQYFTMSLWQEKLMV